MCCCDAFKEVLSVHESERVFETECRFLFCVVCLTLRYLNNISFYLCAGSVAVSRVNDTSSWDRSFMWRQMVLFCSLTLEAVELQHLAFREQDHYNSVTVTNMYTAKSITWEMKVGEKNHETIGGRWLLAQPLGNALFFLFSSSAFLVPFLFGWFVCRVFCFFKFVALFFLLPPPNHVQKAILYKTIFV